MGALQVSQMVRRAALALERMAFVIAEPVAMDVDAALRDAGLRATVTITGGADTGFVLLAATGDFVCEAAAGMLGVDLDEIEMDQHGEVTILELANVLGGHLIHAAGGDDGDWRIGLPELVDAAAAAALVERARPDGCAVLAGMSGHLLLAYLLPC